MRMRQAARLDDLLAMLHRYLRSAVRRRLHAANRTQYRRLIVVAVARGRVHRFRGFQTSFLIQNKAL
jgi:hypothetical protein